MWICWIGAGFGGFGDRQDFWRLCYSSDVPQSMKSQLSLKKQMVWDGVDGAKKSSVDVWIVFVLFACWIVTDVDELIFEVVDVSYAVLVMPAVPDFSRGLLACCEGIAALDVLDAFRC